MFLPKHQNEFGGDERTDLNRGFKMEVGCAGGFVAVIGDKLFRASTSVSYERRCGGGCEEEDIIWVFSFFIWCV
jgi:hypothetical protein